MNAKKMKKIRKVAAKNYRLDFDTYCKFINEQMPLKHRIKFAWATLRRNVRREIFS